MLSFDQIYQSQKWWQISLSKFEYFVLNESPHTHKITVITRKFCKCCPQKIDIVSSCQIMRFGSTRLQSLKNSAVQIWQTCPIVVTALKQAGRHQHNSIVAKCTHQPIVYIYVLKNEYIFVSVVWMNHQMNQSNIDEILSCGSRRSVKRPRFSSRTTSSTTNLPKSIGFPLSCATFFKVSIALSVWPLVTKYLADSGNH